MNWFWLIVSSLVRFLLFGFSLLNDSTGLWYFVDVETETYRDWEIYWISRPRLIETEKFLGCRDRDSSRLRNFSDVETETHRDWKISWMSRLRLIETEKFLGCRDRYSSRLGKSMDVETETSRDWAKDVDTETPLRLSSISATRTSSFRPTTLMYLNYNFNSNININFKFNF